MIVKIIVIRSETINEVMNPSDGHLGRDKNTISGHENSRIAKWSVMGILWEDAVTSCSIEVSWTSENLKMYLL
jgi:hypothetical protein